MIKPDFHVSGARRDHGYRGHLQVSRDEHQAGADQRGDGQQGITLPHPSEHRERPHCGTVHHHREPHQGDDPEGRDRAQDQAGAAPRHPGLSEVLSAGFLVREHDPRPREAGVGAISG